MPDSQFHTKEDLLNRINEIAESKREVFVKPPTKEKGSWLEEVLLNRIIRFIRQAVELNVYTEVEDRLYIIIIVRIAGRTILNEKIKLIWTNAVEPTAPKPDAVRLERRMMSELLKITPVLKNGQQGNPHMEATESMSVALKQASHYVKGDNSVFKFFVVSRVGTQN